MMVALAAYVAYLVNAIQFLMKFQQARSASPDVPSQPAYAGLDLSDGAKS
jgi:hypothetical protein